MKKIEFDLKGPNVMKLSWLLSNGQVVMLTCSNSEKSINGIITACWVAPTSIEPLLITASIGNGEKDEDSYRACHALINETKEFGLNIPTPELTEAILKVGTTHSNEVDKFADSGLTPMQSNKIKAPMIAECFMNIECKIIDQFTTGDHTVFVAKPVAVYMNDDVMTDGRFSEKYIHKNNQVQICELITAWNMW
ncbi:MAG: flavin reductase family protein [Prolixibacteraceae bacterium]|jgi:flavin reductase (DIM6/NTAB) family NADH-FMN oxidoreductase RutF